MSTIDLQQAVKTYNIELVKTNVSNGAINWDDVMIESVKRNHGVFFDMALKNVTNTSTLKGVLREAVQRNNMYAISKIIEVPEHILLLPTMLFAVETNNISMYVEMTKLYKVDYRNEALAVAASFNHDGFIHYLLERGAYPIYGFNAAIETNDRIYAGYFYEKLKGKDKIKAKDGIRIAIDAQNISMLEYLVSLGVGSWKEVRSMVHTPADVPMLMDHLDKVDPVDKESMVVNLLKEENVAELEQLVSKSIASNLGIAFLAEKHGKEKIARYFVLKCHLDHLVELQRDIAKKD